MFSELTLKPRISEQERKTRGNIIEEVFRKHHPTLVKEINPEKAAIQLFGVGIIDDNEHESAMIGTLTQIKRSTDLLLLLIRKLRANPHWCSDAIIALRTAGVNMNSIIVALTEAGVNVDVKCVETGIMTDVVIIYYSHTSLHQSFHK